MVSRGGAQPRRWAPEDLQMWGCRTVGLVLLSLRTWDMFSRAPQLAAGVPAPDAATLFCGLSVAHLERCF